MGYNLTKISVSYVVMVQDVVENEFTYGNDYGKYGADTRAGLRVG